MNIFSDIIARNYLILTPIFLNIAIAITLLISLFEDTIHPHGSFLKTSKLATIHISLKVILGVLLILFPLTLFILLTFPKQYNNLYAYGLFSCIIILHAMWISFAMTPKYRFIPYLIALIVIIGRFFSPSLILHDIFIILVVTWFGSFIFSVQNILTKKIFTGMSIAWFFYDITYVWITASVHKVFIVTQTYVVKTLPQNFSLSLVVLGESIGIADLFFAILLLAYIQNFKLKLLALFLFVASNAALEIYAYTTSHYNTFPLLVLWVPIGLGVLLLDRGKTPNTNISS